MATEQKHTPGPWEVAGTITQGRHAIDGAGTHKVPVAVTEWQDGDVSKANARLIAAAPELLTALKKLTAEMVGIGGFGPEIRELVGNTNWSVLTQRVQEAHAAIAKAEG